MAKNTMSTCPVLTRSDSTSFTCFYGNDVYSFQVANPQSVLIFFPGDLQDEDAVMSRSSVANEYRSYSYEETLGILHSKYPCANIFLIRPSHKSQDISMYGDYLDCDADGNVQSYNPHGNAIQTLYELIENYVRSFSHPPLPITLIGFSRGGLVLNQLLTEVGTSPHSAELMQLVNQIHWLDCGNGKDELYYPTLGNLALDFLMRHS